MSGNLDPAGSPRDPRVLPSFAPPLPRLTPKFEPSAGASSFGGGEESEKYEVVIAGVSVWEHMFAMLSLDHESSIGTSAATAHNGG